jgi:hypothetical protein
MVLKMDCLGTKHAAEYFERRKSKLDLNAHQEQKKLEFKRFALSTDSKIKIYGFLCYFIQVLPFIIYSISHSEFLFLNKDDVLCFNDVRYFVATTSIALLVVDLVIIVALMYSIKDVKESWSIKQEINIICIVVVIFLALFALNAIFDGKPEAFINLAVQFQLYFLVGCVPLCILVYYSMFKVSSLTIKERKLEESPPSILCAYFS